MLGGGIYPGMITATIGTGLLLGVVATLARDRSAPAALRVVVRRPPDGLRGHRARVVPRDPDRQRARARPDRRGLLARVSTSRRSPCSSASASSRRRGRVPLPAARRGGRKEELRRRLAARSPDATSTACAPGRAVLPLAVPRPQALAGRAHPFSLSAAPDGPLAAHHRQGARRPHRAVSPTLEPGTRVVAEGPFGVFTERARRRDKVAADRGRDRDHADPRAARAHARRRRRRLPRRRRGRT